MADVRAAMAELHSGFAEMEERYFSTEATTRVGSAADVRVEEAAEVELAAAVVVV